MSSLALIGIECFSSSPTRRAGERGVELDWLRDDMVRTMYLIGVGNVTDLDRSFLELP
jgi:isopentenyl diphosphate isomerase/L-lactate dehydrogenase-like FMN-dependent dehydrogenase